MAEQKKRGFGALERRIHELEEEDRRVEQESKGERREPARSEPSPSPREQRDEGQK